MANHYDTDEIKSRLQITTLFIKDGHEPRRSGSTLLVCCPFHDEKTPSCAITEHQGTFHCYGCGIHGDIFTYWQESRGVDFKTALPDLAALAGIGARDYIPTAPIKKNLRKCSPRNEKLPDPLTGKPLQKWLSANDTLTNNPEEQSRITAWRGYSNSLVSWATNRGLIGLFSYYGTPREAFLVEMPTPSLTTQKTDEPLEQSLIPVSCHIRLAANTKGNKHPKQSWRFSPSGCGSWPFIAGDHTTAKYLFILEGQWDALALIDVMEWHTLKKWPSSTCVIGLRGATSGDKLLAHYQLRKDAIAFAFADADTAGATWFFSPCRHCPHHPKKSHTAFHECATDQCTDRKPAFLEALEQKISYVHGLQPAIHGADFNDLHKYGHITRKDITDFIRRKLPDHRRKPTGPTFLQWCKNNKSTDPLILQATAHVIADKRRPPGRKPLKSWLRHWNTLHLKPETIAKLQTTWNTWKNETTRTH